jgi:hypothetical protein
MRTSSRHLLTKSLITIASLIATHTASAAIGDYSAIENEARSNSKAANICLRTFSNSKKVEIGKCNAAGTATDFTSMRMWKLVKQSGDFYTLQNKYKNDAGVGECLRTFSGNNNVEVDTCNAKGGATDLTSMRLWKLVEVFKDNNYSGHTHYMLENKYKGDLVGTHPKCLKMQHPNHAVEIATCNGSGTDLGAYRNWKSQSGFLHNTHPYGKAWQPTHIAHIAYSLPNKPANGFDSITFPVKIVKSKAEKGFFYSSTFTFVNGNLGYIGIQPRGKDSGMAAFSVFGSGIVRKASHCSGNADGGAGSSCSTMFDLKIGRTYNLIVKRDAKDSKLWRGYVEDTVTKKMYEIGSWEPRVGSKGIDSWERSFVEYYGYINSCVKIPYSESIHYHPIATSGTKSTTAIVKKPYLAEANSSGRCLKHASLNSDDKTDHWVVKVQGKAE